MSGGGNIKVVVRCRPLNAREIARGATELVRMEGNQTILRKPDDIKATSKDNDDYKAFTFDQSYWSADKSDPAYADQQKVYSDLGVDLLDHAFDGYNCCIFAYGQTGSGKSYSMMGYGEDKGIIPRTCSELFERINQVTDPQLTTRVEVSYIEIYNEKVRDLLNPKNKGNLKVREHPSMGPYVEDLSKLVVNSFDDINRYMDEGNKARTVAATNMNETSSRSHAVFSLILTQKRQDEATKLETEKVARISLVDLAGSERANSTGATGARLKEGANINRSLTTLGKVIAGLAEQSAAEGVKKGRKKEVFIPYRDSVLTWLLKDSLGGNSKTAMIAAISPADYEETLSTLRYADQAKKIKNKAVVNEDPNAKLIRELKSELDLLRDRLTVYAPEVAAQLAAQSVHKPGSTSTGSHASRSTDRAPKPIVNGNDTIEFKDNQGNTRKMTKSEIVDQLQSSQKLLTNLNETWEDKLKRTQEIQIEREKALEELGILVHKNNVGVYAPKKMPHLVNLNEDPLMSECLVYQLKPGKTHVGKNGSEKAADIKLSGANIEDEHCIFDNDNGIVTLHPQGGSLTIVNGMRISEPKRLHSGFRVILGSYHTFRFNHPEEVRRERDRQRSTLISSGSGNGNLQISMPGPPTPGIGEDELPPWTPTTENTIYSEPIDWNFAKQEAARNYYSSEATITGLKDDELDKLYGNISKIRNSRRSRPVSRATFAGDDDDGSSKGSIRNSMATTTVDMDGLESVYTDATAPHGELEEHFKTEKEKRDKLQRELEDQKKFYETRINRMSMQLLTPDPSVKERALISRVLTKWKRLRNVSLAETLFTEAVSLKEANIIARQFGKEATYQFTIVEDGPFANPKSFWDNTSTALHDCQQDDDTDLLECAKPCVGVRVLDRKHNAIYTWSLDKLKARLQKMRNLQNFMDRPQYRKHLNWEDPFYEEPSPKYSLIGSAATSMRNLVLQQPYESCVPIVCRTTGRILGQLHLLISPIIRSAQGKDVTSQLQVGQEVSFEVRLLTISDLKEEDASRVHVQFRLSSFGGPPSLNKVFATDPVSGFGDTAIQLDYSQTLSMVATEGMLKVLEHGMITFEVYGQLKAPALASLERWDEQREQGSQQHLASKDSLHMAPTHGGVGYERQADHLMRDADGGLERRPEEELLAAERHDVVARIQVCELMPNGKYVPVQVTAQNELDRGVFTLRQGLQRRIQITLSHTSGHQLPWNALGQASIGRARLLDGKGRIIDAPNDVTIPIKLGHPDVVYNNDGTSELTAYGAWDSSQHECAFLNCLTAANSRVLLELQWQVDAPEKCAKKMHFAMDIAVQIQGRDRSTTSSALRKLLGGSSGKRLAYCSGVFLVHLRPPMTRRVSQLWRLNTASKYVRGEELLERWRPRGVSLVNDFKRVRHRICRLEETALTSQVLTLLAARSQTSNGCMCPEEQPNPHVIDDLAVTTKEAQEGLLRKTVHLWQQQKAAPIMINPEPPSMQEARTLPSTTKLLAEVKLVSKTGNVSKKGYLTTQENALDDRWVKRWFVIRRPYMYLYSSRNEAEELGVINITSVRIDYNRELEKMLQRPNVFALYTNNNAYTIQAGSRPDMADWITKVDPLFPLDRLDE